MAENTRNCTLEAYKLQLENRGSGKVCHVPSVGHTYYLLDPSKEDEFALNQEDNGFGRYPRFTVGQVLRLHSPLHLLITAE